MSESRWARPARDAINAAILEARSKGLAGKSLEKHVRANGYPFGERAMTPYKVWLGEARRLLAPHAKHGDLPLSGGLAPAPGAPLRVMSLRCVAEGSLWTGRAYLGDFVSIGFRRGVLGAAVASTDLARSYARPFFREQIAEPTAEVCDLREAAEILEATGLFDFSAVDLSLADSPQ